jgi:hypothetical protein
MRCRCGRSLPAAVVDAFRRHRARRRLAALGTHRAMKTLLAETLDRWRDWLDEHHASESEVWLVFYKQQTGIASIEYEDALDEALCFGWVDSLVKRLDDRRYALKFTPRRPESRWSAKNRQAPGRIAPFRSTSPLAAPTVFRLDRVRQARGNETQALEGGDSPPGQRQGAGTEVESRSPAAGPGGDIVAPIGLASAPPRSPRSASMSH